MIVSKKRKEPKPQKAKGVIRRCLGPGDEHSFRSPDPVSIRICNRCKQRIYKDPHYQAAKEVD